MSQTIENRYEFTLFFDVRDGNPNGDPDADNLPRTDPLTGHGLVTDVCLKRKIRNYIEITRGNTTPNKIYVREKAVLNELNKEALNNVEKKPKKSGNKKDDSHIDAARDWMCSHFYDIRTFGAVMTGKEANCGQVRGPIQFAFARSIDPITPMTHTITRMAVTNENDRKKERTMGRKHTVPYGLYRADGFISASLAAGTGFSEADLDLFWEALRNMFDHDRSAARGVMSARKLYVFKHESKWGNAPAQNLLEHIEAHSKNPEAPRAFADYEIGPRDQPLPTGIEMVELL